MDYDQACNTDSSKVTLPSDDKSKVSKRSMLVENNAKNVHNDEKSNLYFIENEVFKIQQFVKNEKMTQNNVEKCKKKFECIKRKIKLMKTESEKERVLIDYVLEIIVKLEKNNFFKFQKSDIQ